MPWILTAFVWVCVTVLIGCGVWRAARAADLIRAGRGLEGETFESGIHSVLHGLFAAVGIFFLLTGQIPFVEARLAPLSPNPELPTHPTPVPQARNSAAVPALSVPEMTVCEIANFRDGMDKQAFRRMQAKCLAGVANRLQKSYRRDTPSEAGN